MNNPGKELTPAEATQAILASVTLLPAEQVALRDAAGRILREQIRAERDNPPFDRVCMDGAAIDSRAWLEGARRFKVQATQGAGAVPLTLSARESAIEVMTGAVMPVGTDCVIPVEDYAAQAGVITLHDDATTESWRNVQRRAADSAAGEIMLDNGIRLNGAELAVVASAGLAQVRVTRQPRIRVLSTGDELVEPGLPVASHQVRRSNAHAVTAALRLQGFTAVDDEHLRDVEETIRARIATSLESVDVLILSGGVSKGKFDFVPSALQAAGVTRVFHHVAQRPGRPLWFGVGPRGQLVFGLPGNPVSTLVCLRRYVVPALRAASGETKATTERIALAATAGGRKLTFYMPVLLRPAEREGATLAEAKPPHGSGDFLALAGTAGFVELPPQSMDYPAGFSADFYRW